MWTTFSTKIKEPVIDLRRCGTSPWIELVRKYQPASSRYCALFSRAVVGVSVILYDRKLRKSFKFSVPYKANLEPYISEKKESYPQNMHNPIVQKILDRGVAGDFNSYLKSVNLDTFIDQSMPFRVIKEGIIAPYTNLDLIDDGQWIGAQFYRGEGKEGKRFMQSLYPGAYKGAFHPVRWGDFKDIIITEGLREAVLFSQVYKRARILECGGLNKLDSLLENLQAKFPESHIYVILDKVEKEVKSAIEAKAGKFTKIISCEKYKDFAEQFFIEKNLKVLRDLLFAQDLSSAKGTYKALGIEGHEMVFYSRISSSVVKLNADRTEQVIRFAVDPSGLLDKKLKEKKEIVGKIFELCAAEGIYNGDQVYSQGLWKKDNDYFYNTGQNLYKITEDGLVNIPYEKAISNDFIFDKSITKLPVLRDQGFDLIHFKELESAFLKCHWKHSYYGSFLLGFLAQSFYSGVLELRPNLWIQSDRSTAGKSWLCGWIKEYLIPSMKKREGDMSTISGSRQLMANNAVLFHADELGEKGSVFEKEVKAAFQLLRSSAGGQLGESPISKGTPGQKAILQKLKFSTIISVIEGREFLTEPDYNRMFEIKLIKGNKKEYLKRIRPALESLQNDKTLGFAYFMISRFFIFKKFFEKFEWDLSELYDTHRLRGMAAILAAYSAAYNDYGAGKRLLNQLKKDRKMFAPFKKRNAPDNDFFGELLFKMVPIAYLPKDCAGARPFIDAAVEGELETWGIKYASPAKLYINLDLSFDFISKILKKNLDKNALGLYLKETPVFSSKDSRTERFGVGEDGYVRRYSLCFFINNYLEEGDDDDDPKERGAESLDKVPF